MRWIWAGLGLVLMWGLVQGVAVEAQGNPTPQVEAAIAALNQQISGIGEPDSWEFSFGPSSNSNLGCTLVAGSSLGRSVTAYRVILGYGSTTYIYYVSQDLSMIVPCSAGLLGSATLSPTTAANPTATPAIGTPNCTLRASVNAAFVRENPSTDAPTIGTAPASQSYAVVGRNADSTWYHIQYNAQTRGWVGSSVATLTGNCGNLPLVTENASPAVTPSPSVILVTPTNLPVDAAPCPANFVGFVTPRVALGDVDVMVADAVFLSLREQASGQSQVVANLAPGTVISEVVGGPICQQGNVWWFVRIDTISGWVPEASSSGQYFLTPPERAGVAPREVTVISAETIGNLAASNGVELEATYIAWSADSRRVALVTAEGVLVYEYPSLTALEGLRQVLADGEADVTALAFDTSGDMLALGYANGAIELVDLRTEAVSALTSRHSSAVTGLAFDPNGLLMSSSGAGNSGALRVLDTRGLDKQTGIAPIVNAVLLDAAVLDMAVYFDGDFTYIGALTAAGFELYEAHNPNRLQVVTFEEEIAAGMVAAVEGGFIYSTETRLAQFAIGGQAGQVVMMDFEDERVVAWAALQGSEDAVLVAVALENGAEGRLIFLEADAVLETFDLDVQALAFSPDGGTLALILEAHGLQFWEVAP